MTEQIISAIVGYAFFDDGGNIRFGTPNAPQNDVLPTDIGYHVTASKSNAFAGTIVSGTTAPGGNSHYYIFIALLCGGILLAVLLFLLLAMFFACRALGQSQLRYWRLRQTELKQDRERRLLATSTSLSRSNPVASRSASLRRVPSTQSNMAPYSPVPQMPQRQPPPPQQQPMPMQRMGPGPRMMSVPQMPPRQQRPPMQMVPLYNRPVPYANNGFPAAPPQLMQQQQQRMSSFAGPAPIYPPSRSFVENMAQRFDNTNEATNNTNTNNAAERNEGSPSAAVEQPGGTLLRRRSSREPTPEEQFRMDLLQRQQALAQAEAVAENTSGTNASADDPNPSTAASLLGGASGLFTSVKSVANQVALNLKKGANEVSARAQVQARQMDHQLNVSRYKAAFADVARTGEALLASYRCAAMHGGRRVTGTLFVTSHHILFVAQTNSALSSATDAIRSAMADMGGPAATESIVGVKQVIPLVQVASVQLSVALETLDAGPPYFLPLPAPHVVPTALQIYSPQGHKLFQFLDFNTLLNKTNEILVSEGKGTALERAYNYIDHAWRESVTVPLDGVKYDTGAASA